MRYTSRETRGTDRATVTSASVQPSAVGTAKRGRGKWTKCKTVSKRRPCMQVIDELFTVTRQMAPGRSLLSTIAHAAAECVSQ